MNPSASASTTVVPAVPGTEPAPASAIASYHAHIYYDPQHTRALAAWLRERISERFEVQLGRWHDQPVGPHHVAMYQVAFTTALFEHFVPWLMLNRRGLAVLVHPNTLQPRADHLEHALWLGDKLPLKGEVLEEAIEPSQISPIVPNSRAAGAAPAA